eukprot:TCONS_00059725-protein
MKTTIYLAILAFLATVYFTEVSSMSTGGGGMWETKKSLSAKKDVASLIPDICNICSKAQQMCSQQYNRAASANQKRSAKSHHHNKRSYAKRHFREQHAQEDAEMN